MKAVSVVVPVYNTEPYLRECLDSLIRSDMFADCEVLIVNDGTQDGSAAIMADYASRYENIRVLTHERNRGLSAARNTGLDSAAGEYVFFLDSDDRLSEDYLSLLCREAREHDCDLVCAGFSIWKDGELTAKLRPVLHTKETMTGTEWFHRRADLRDDLSFVWCSLYKRSYLEKNALRFDEELRLYEDVLFTPTAAAYAARVRAVENYGYHYRVRRGSLIGDGVQRRDVEWLIRIVPMLEKDALKTVGRSLYPVISMCLYYIGELGDKGMLTRTECRSYCAQLRRVIEWERLRAYAATPREKLKWLLWRLDMGLFYPLVRKNNDG